MGREIEWINGIKTTLILCLTSRLHTSLQNLGDCRYTEMLLKQCAWRVRHMVSCSGPLTRRLSDNAYSRVVERRGDYATLEDYDLTMFERLLGGSAVLTDPDDVAPYNEDWLRTCKGGCKQLAQEYLEKPRWRQTQREGSQISQIRQFRTRTDGWICG